MQLLTATIREFQKLSSGIKTNSFLPILSYLKIGNNSIIKTNLNQFVDFSIQSDKEIILVDEKMLYNFINATSQELVSIVTKDKYVIISDGNQSLKHQLQDITLFPTIPTLDSDYTSISSETLQAIFVANNLTIDADIPDMTTVVFIGNKSVASTDRFTAYKEPISETIILPLIKPAATLISKFKNVEYATYGNYDFFKTSSGVFGFAQSELKFIDIQSQIILESELDGFEVNKHDVISFCEMASASSKNGSAECIFQTGLLKMDDNDVDIHIEKEAPTFKCKGPFKFDPVLMSKLLKSVPGDMVMFYPGDRKYCLTDSTRSYMSIIMGRL